MPPPRKCPNCNAPVAGHAENGCVLAALIQVLRERGEHSERRLLRIHTACDVDHFWNDVARIVDDLGEGRYSS